MHATPLPEDEEAAMRFDRKDTIMNVNPSSRRRRIVVATVAAAVLSASVALTVALGAATGDRGGWTRRPWGGRSPVAGATRLCPAPFDATADCRTATPKSAEKMLRKAVALETKGCPKPFPRRTRCGLATVPANWVKPDGRTLAIWYALVPAPNGKPAGVTVPFMGLHSRTPSVRHRFCA
jgi:hypothetical protein